MTSPTPTPAATNELPSGLANRNRRQRRWSLALVGVLLIVGSGLVFLLLFVNAGDRSPVLAIARPVPAGQAIDGADLQIVRVGADAGVDTISEAERSDVIGRTAAVDLIPGTLLVDGQLGEPVTLAPGEAVVGLDLVGGEYAVPDLVEGDEVLVVLTFPQQAGVAVGGDGDDGGEQSEDVVLGQVLSRGTISTVRFLENADDSVVASVIVPEDVSKDIAGANSADRVAVVLVPPQ